MKRVVGYHRDGVRFVDKLPEGDWRLATGEGFVIAACPQHPPRKYESIKTTLEDHTETKVTVLDMVWMGAGELLYAREILRDVALFSGPHRA